MQISTLNFAALHSLITLSSGLDRMCSLLKSGFRKISELY